MTDKTVYLYTGNHQTLVGIEDFVTMIQTAYSGKANVVITREFVANELNVIVDEFTNYLSNSSLRRIKISAPNTKVILILTEFVEQSNGIKTFNYFGGLLNASVIAASNIFLKLRRPDFGTATFKDYLLAAVYAPVFACAFLRSIFSSFFKKKNSQYNTFMKKYGSPIYLHMRYLGLESHLCFIDAVISSHPSIDAAYQHHKGFGGSLIHRLGTLYPAFHQSVLDEPLLINKVLNIQITGSKSSYRSYWASHINKLISRYGLASNFTPVSESYFGKNKNKKPLPSSAFSLHPPQSKGWRYASPTRIFRAIAIDKNIPILTKHFIQHPIEDLAIVWHGIETLELLYETFLNKESFELSFKSRIRKYNDLAKENNERIIEKSFVI